MTDLRRPSARLLVLAALFSPVAAGVGGARPDAGFGQPQIGAVRGEVKVLPDARVVNFREVVYRGPIDLNPTLERIRAGKKLEHKNDGAVFLNRERLLPVQKDRQYYREFVVWDPAFNAKHKIKVRFPGPQRVVIGKKGEVYYTGDHYSSWKKVR
jgi:guanyl-specific ribonuclease Sa